ncbi:hypothetical protein KXR53_23395 [Inquilinus limosus]|uniref:hypothetical protein n=1 Tax=Inquilinus limosus TaxID=171674 RepID=UPI003F14FC4D
MFWSGSISFSSHRYESGARWLDIFHLSCSRHTLGVSDKRWTGEFEIRFAVRNAAGEDMTTDRRLCLRVSAQAVELWIAAAGPMIRSKPKVRRRVLLTAHARPAIEAGVPDGPPLLDGGTIVLDGLADTYRW